MKKTLCLFLVPVLLCACQKKYCWKCTTITYTSTAPSGSVFTGYTNDTTKHPFSVCDKTATEIKAYEVNASSVLTEGNIIVNTSTTTTCNK
ncbi:hypothetical protein HDF24_07455 [Mucilaginibacter sp. X4EP1]|uniref:hypothetical protein n=1 Tax=Mucilaginibacter sp. X4EP1 TaxID=2723092 RepID=UPI002166DAC3|nr:hypothetical protein [Mucilaginibacter sp. X4EP1]MCS3814150.1 hypothetical protein [Mucilaginibacter sp. X4EP1]